MDYKKLTHLQTQIELEALHERYEDLPTVFLQFLNNDILKYCFENYKTGIKESQSSRVLNNWINVGVLKVNSEDKGKNKRFSRVENIWLSIVVESRKFGIPLENLKKAREYLLESPIRNFNLLKFGIVQTILQRPQMLMLLDNGDVSLLSYNTYQKWMNNKRSFPTHINFSLLDFIKQEYPRNALDINLDIEGAHEDINKLKLLYFLKTGDYKYMKVYLADHDVRIVEDSIILSSNKELKRIIENWSFQKIKIVINEEVETLIEL
ncbi:MAG: hypothetical protein LBI72_06700 [Flavobacteriaceae bacterium]|jgi:hypothetical protein|nr:hypothetical protein [Flavobacteriaceae bacterium]